MVTFSDMTTLLLCFFVLIIAFSEIKKEDEFRAVVEEVKKAFGMKGGGGRLPTDDDPELTFIQRLEALNLQMQKMDNESNAQDPGMEGQEQETTVIRPGQLMALGGPIVFDRGSATLTPLAKKQLAKISEKIKGYNHLIEVRGHASSMEADDMGGRYTDLWDLSGARAKAVFDYLTSEEVGINSKRFRLIQNADREPVVTRVYNVDEQSPNRRVVVYISENIVREFTESMAHSGL